MPLNLPTLPKITTELLVDDEDDDMKNPLSLSTISRNNNIVRMNTIEANANSTKS